VLWEKGRARQEILEVRGLEVVLAITVVIREDY
jgi:hypothetical protein